jgi:hypothetical protein
MENRLICYDEFRLEGDSTGNDNALVPSAGILMGIFIDENCRRRQANEKSSEFHRSVRNRRLLPGMYFKMAQNGIGGGR